MAVHDLGSGGGQRPRFAPYTLFLTNSCRMRAAIAKRVALLLVVMLFAGTALFFVGLELAFPKYD